MRVLLIQPPVRDFYDTEVRLQPLGLAYLQAALLHFVPGTAVRVLDCRRGWGRTTAPLPGELNFLRDYFFTADRSPFAAFGQYYHFGASYEDAAREAKRYAPDLVGISALFTAYSADALATAQAVKKALPGVPVVVGGGHATACPEAVLADPHVDFVIRGEGERPVVELVKALSTGAPLMHVPNLGFKEHGAAVWTPLAENFQFDSLPDPHFGDLPADCYTMQGQPLAFVQTSRGCPLRCAFCSVQSVFGARRRARSVSSVIAEIRRHAERGIRVIDFEDDNLSLNRPVFMELCRRLQQEFCSTGLRFTAMNGLLYHTLDEEVIGGMAEAGFSDINISLVTADAAAARALRRPLMLRKYRAAVRAARAAGLHTVSYQILGFPGDSLQSACATLSIAAQLPVLIGASLYYAAPGSSLAPHCTTWSAAQCLSARSTAMMPAGELLRDHLYTLFICARIINFLKSFDRGEISFEDLLNTPAASARAALGADLLARLMSEHTLYASTKNGLMRLAHFQWPVFEALLKEMPFVATLRGGTIVMPSRGAAPPAG